MRGPSDTAQVVASSSTTSGGASASIQTLTDTTISSSGIDESRYSYFFPVGWVVPPTTTTVAFHSVSINYTL